METPSVSNLPPSTSSSPEPTPLLQSSVLSSVWSTCYSLGELKMIEVQVLIRSGIPRFDIIGLPESMIREGKDRILSALSQLGIELPTRKILVNLNPGDIPKEGSHFDLPILAGILFAAGILKKPEGKIFLWGELGLDGMIRPVDDILAHILFAQTSKDNQLLCADRNPNLDFVLDFLPSQPKKLSHILELFDPKIFDAPKKLKIGYNRQGFLVENSHYSKVLDIWIEGTPENSIWDSLKGTHAQRLVWALAILGRHHILLEGCPGVGKSSWCFASSELQPPPSVENWGDRFRFLPDQSSNIVNLQELIAAPFQSPHHSASRSAIIGGGSGKITGGALTRAHGGVLFLDEFSEFSRDILESLREPLECKTITIARRGLIQKLNADVQILATMNPCKCGRYGSSQLCLCQAADLQRYRSRLSLPLLERFHFFLWWAFETQNEKLELNNDAF